LIESGSVLYGVTFGGGINSSGVVYRMNSDGTNFNVLHEFDYSQGGNADSASGLTLIGSTLYGMTAYGGPSDRGSIFKINTDGTGFAILRSFAGGALDGSRPRGTLIQSGSLLYGMTSLGGTLNAGTIFSINPDGSNFSILHSFGGNDGSGPYGLLLSDSFFYGIAVGGGSANKGTLFEMNVDGSGFALLHTFTGATTDGNSPRALAKSGSVLYGATIQGGTSNLGTVFSYDLAAVPEPGTLALAGIGTILLAGYGWRKKRSAG